MSRVKECDNQCPKTPTPLAEGRRRATVRALGERKQRPRGRDRHRAPSLAHRDSSRRGGAPLVRAVLGTPAIRLLRLSRVLPEAGASAPRRNRLGALERGAHAGHGLRGRCTWGSPARQRLRICRLQPDPAPRVHWSRRDGRLLHRIGRRGVSARSSPHRDACRSARRRGVRAHSSTRARSASNPQRCPDDPARTPGRAPGRRGERPRQPWPPPSLIRPRRPERRGEVHRPDERRRSGLDRSDLAGRDDEGSSTKPCDRLPGDSRGVPRDALAVSSSS